MKYVPTILGTLLGLMFIAFSLPFLLGAFPAPPPPPEGSALEGFTNAFNKTGYVNLVKVCELLGGLLVLIPRTRILGLLILTPIVINIVAFHTFITGGEGVFSPILIAIEMLIVALFWFERRALAALVAKPSVRTGLDAPRV